MRSSIQTLCRTVFSWSFLRPPCLPAGVRGPSLGPARAQTTLASVPLRRLESLRPHFHMRCGSKVQRVDGRERRWDAIAQLPMTSSGTFSCSRVSSVPVSSIIPSMLRNGQDVKSTVRYHSLYQHLHSHTHPQTATPLPTHFEKGKEPK